MLVLIGIVPAQFVLDLGSTTYQIERTRDATVHLSQFTSAITPRSASSWHWAKA